MDINIKTKFNIGDKIWIPDYYHDQWFVRNKDGYLVSSMKIYIDSNGQKIFYIFKDNDRMQEYPLRLCFSSYKECEIWCDKKNN